MAAFDFPTSPADGQLYEANGVRYQWNATDSVWKGTGGIAPLSNKMRVIAYTTPGTIAYVKPAGLKALQVELFGSGGGSGGAGVTTATTMSVGGGGGGGGYSRKLYQASELAVSESLVIGVGGAGGDGVATNGVAGGVSTFKALSVTGGGGGTGGGAASTAGFASRGSAGSGNGGDFNGQGNSGHYGLRLPHGVPLSVQPGYGGAGYGRAQFFYDAYATTTTAANNPAIGDGANGAGNGVSQTATVGGKGGDGYAIFTEYYTENDTVPGGNFLQEVVTTWQPQLQFANANVGMTFSSQYGSAIKQGSMVTLSFDFTLTAKGTSVGGARLTNLPYPLDTSAGGGNVAGAIGYVNALLAGANTVVCYISAGTPSELVFSKLTPAGTGQANMANTDFTDTSRIIGSITYRTVA